MSLFDNNSIENMNILNKTFPTTATSAAAFKTSSQSFKTLSEGLKPFYTVKI